MSKDISGLNMNLQASYTRENVTITFVNNGLKKDSFLLIYPKNFQNFFDTENIIDTLVFKNGYCETQFSISEPSYIIIRNSEFFQRLFFFPGYKSKIIIDKLINNEVILSYEGNGKVANQYLTALRKSDFLSNQSKIKDTEHYIEILNEKYKKLDSIYFHFYEKIAKNDVISKNFFMVEKIDLDYSKRNRLLSYIEENKRKGVEINDLYIKYIKNESGKFNVLSQSSRSFYNFHLISYVVNIGNKTIDSVAIKKRGYYAFALDYISKYYSKNEKSYTTAYVLNFLVENFRSYPKYLPSIDSLIITYGKNTSETFHKNILRKYRLKKLEQNDIFSEGDTLDDFILVNGNNKTFKIKDLLVATTVLDLWASWCGNCIEIFPLIAKCEQKFKNNENLKFLHVSVDNDKSAWLKSINKYNLDPENTFWVQGGLTSSFSKKLDVAYLPRNIILNKEGRLLKMYAPHIGESSKFNKLILDSLNN